MKKQIKINRLTYSLLAVMGLSMASGAMIAPTFAQTGSVSAKAADDVIQTTLNLSQIFEKVLLHSPKLARFPHDLRMSEALVLQAGIRPNPRLSLAIDNVFGSGSVSGVSGAETSIRLSQIVELGDKRQRRVELASASRQAINRQYEQARVNVLADVTQDYYQVLRLSALTAWLDERISLEKDALERSQVLRTAGVVVQADVSKLALNLSRSRLESKGLASQLRLAKLKLSSNWLGAESNVQVTGSLAVSVTSPTLQHLLGTIETAPEYLALLSEETVREAQYHLARTQSVANLDTSIGLKRSEVTDDTGLLLSVSMPLQLTDPNEGNIRAAKIALQQQQERQPLYRKQLRSSLTQIYLSMVTSLDKSQGIQAELLPQARQFLQDTRAAYGAGQVNVLQLADAQQQLFSLQREWIEARYQALSQMLSLEKITGQSLFTAPNA